MEIAIAAAIGATLSGVTGGDPLEGALIGGITGGIGSGFGAAAGPLAGNTGIGALQQVTQQSVGGGFFSGLTSFLPSISLGQAVLAGGAILSSSAASEEGEFAQQQGDFQAGDLTQQAEFTRLEAEEEEKEFKRRQSAADSLFFAAAPNRSLIVSSDFRRETAVQAKKISTGGERSATRLESAASLARAGGVNARRSSNRKAASSLLSGLEAFA